MEELQVEDWYLLVDKVTTGEIYKALPLTSDTDVALKNFTEVLKYEAADMQMLLQRLDVDNRKPFQFSALPVENNTKMLYTGVFYVHGAVMMGDFDAWDVVLDMFCLSLTADFADLPPEMGETVIEISFEAVMPWILTESM
ncbi:MAG: hypothetical protein KIG60_03115 [Caryophanon sp.]|nr:hypothetical protein [Caryophanon sp.]